MLHYAEEMEEKYLSESYLLSLLRSAVESCAAYDGRIGIYLSGGVDSSAVLCLAQESNANIVPIVVGKPDSVDRIAGIELCKAVGLEPIIQNCPNEPDYLNTYRILFGLQKVLNLI